MNVEELSNNEELLKKWQEKVSERTEAELQKALTDYYGLEVGTGKPKIKGLLIDVYKLQGVNVVEFEGTLENLYKLTDCSCIDIASRKVVDNVYDFVVDDEGLFRQPAVPSVYDIKEQPMLVGNALICNHDDEGNLASLTDEQIEDLKKRCCTAMYTDDEDKTHVFSILLGADYE